MKINSKNVILLSILLFSMTIGINAYGWQIFQRDIPYRSQNILNISEFKFTTPERPTLKLPESALKSGDNYLEGLSDSEIEELKQLLTDAYYKAYLLGDVFDDDHWLNFQVKDFIAPETATYKIRAIIKRQTTSLALIYAHLISKYEDFFDGMLIKRDGTPCEPGDFRRMLWGSGDMARMTLEEIKQECTSGSRCTTLKWLLGYADSVYPDVITVARRSPDAYVNNIISERGMSWEDFHRENGETMNSWAELWFSILAHSRAFGFRPIPPPQIGF